MAQVTYSTQVDSWRERLACERRQAAEAQAVRRKLLTKGGVRTLSNETASSSLSFSCSSPLLSTADTLGRPSFARRSAHLPRDTLTASVKSSLGSGALNDYTSTAAAAMRDISPTWERHADSSRSHASLEWIKNHSLITQGGADAWPWAPPEGHGIPSWCKDTYHCLYPTPQGCETRVLHHLARAPWGSLSASRVGLF